MAAAAHNAIRHKGDKRDSSVDEEVLKSLPVNVAQAFEKHDEDSSGNIDEKELLEVLEEIERRVKPNHAAKFIHHFEKGPLDPAKPTLKIASFANLYKAINEFKPKEEFLRNSILGKDKPLPYQDKMRDLYTNFYVVWSVAFIIVANFIVNILEKELDPDPLHPKYRAGVWEGLDVMFNWVFLLELLVNMYGYGGPVRAFFKNGWNCFDSFIVFTGMLLMGLPEDVATQTNLGKLKLLRAFRVFRLFKRVKSLNKIIVSLLAAVPGCANAFLILFIFFCIYAILAVDLFRDFGIDGTYLTNDLDNLTHEVSSLTDRGFTNGIEYYGTYTRAMFTLFQVMTGESWAEAIARPVLFGLFQDSTMTVGFFYVSFVILTQMVLINVVVAVLLDTMVDPNLGRMEPMSDEEVDNFLEFVKSHPEYKDYLRVLGEAKELPAPGDSALERRVVNVEAKLDSVLTALDLLLKAQGLAPSEKVPPGTPALAA